MCMLYQSKRVIVMKRMVVCVCGYNIRISIIRIFVAQICDMLMMMIVGIIMIHEDDNSGDDESRDTNNMGRDEMRRRRVKSLLLFASICFCLSERSELLFCSLAKIFRIQIQIRFSSIWNANANLNANSIAAKAAFACNHRIVCVCVFGFCVYVCECLCFCVRICVRIATLFVLLLCAFASAPAFMRLRCCESLCGRSHEASDPQVGCELLVQKQLAAGRSLVGRCRRATIPCRFMSIRGRFMTDQD